MRSAAGQHFCPLLFLLYTSEHFFILVNKLIGFVDDSTLIDVVPSPGIRVAIAESLIRDLDRVSEWCDLLGMKLNASKTKTMIVARSCTPCKVMVMQFFVPQSFSNISLLFVCLFVCLFFPFSSFCLLVGILGLGCAD